MPGKRQRRVSLCSAMHAALRSSDGRGASAASATSSRSLVARAQRSLDTSVTQRRGRGGQWQSRVSVTVVGERRGAHGGLARVRDEAVLRSVVLAVALETCSSRLAVRGRLTSWRSSERAAVRLLTLSPCYPLTAILTGTHSQLALAPPPLGSRRVVQPVRSSRVVFLSAPAMSAFGQSLVGNANCGTANPLMQMAGQMQSMGSSVSEEHAQSAASRSIGALGRIGSELTRTIDRLCFMCLRV